jgi:hypothetical protein
VTPGVMRVPVDVVQGGQVAFPLVPGAVVEIPAGAAQFPTGTVPELELTLLHPSTLPLPVPRGFTPVAAAELAPDGVTFTSLGRLTLPNQGRVSAGQLVILLYLNATTRTYEQVGLGRVSADGTVITTLSGGLTSFSTVVFAATAEDATRLFLLPVAGNNQRAEPGEVLPEPLVVRLEDQFGNPVVGEAIAATITRGDGTFVEADVVTDANGEARFEVRVGTEEEDLVVQVTTSDIPDVRPVQFFAIIGEFDTPGLADALAVADEVIYLADRAAGGFVDGNPKGGLGVFDQGCGRAG